MKSLQVQEVESLKIIRFSEHLLRKAALTRTIWRKAKRLLQEQLDERTWFLDTSHSHIHLPQKCIWLPWLTSTRPKPELSSETLTISRQPKAVAQPLVVQPGTELGSNLTTILRMRHSFYISKVGVRPKATMLGQRLEPSLCKCDAAWFCALHWSARTCAVQLHVLLRNLIWNH